MPYSVKKRKCKTASGEKGSYVITKKKDNKKLSCHTSKEKAQSAVRARHANESEITSDILEMIYERILLEYKGKKRKFNGSHPDESYQPFDEEWFDKKGMTTWDEDRETTKQYLKDIGLL